MANKNKTSNTADNEMRSRNETDKFYKKQSTTLNNLLGQANLNLYGTDRTSDIESLNDKFQTILNKQLENITGKDTESITSFLNQVVSTDRKTTAIDEMLSNQFMSLTGDEYSTMQSFIYDAYRNRLLEQSDLHEVATSLIELSEAILITRDAIISTDVVEGRMSRTLKFDNVGEDEANNNINIVENMETKFGLLEKIKNFVIPKTLEYGEYYVYCIPYSVLFKDLEKTRNKDFGGRFYRESAVAIYEGFEEPKNKKDKNADSFDNFIDKLYDDYYIQESTSYVKTEEAKEHIKESKISKEDFSKDIKNILNNISISNAPVSIPVLEEGAESLEYLKNTTFSYLSEETKDEKKQSIFDKVNDGTYLDKNGKPNKESDYSDITDCYVKMIEPTRIIPLKIVNTVFGYYYVTDEDITPLSGAVSSTLYFTKFEEHRKESTVIDALADRVVKSFNKPFLEKNIKFKEAIVDCFNYYNLNEKRLKFQFIPAEYIQVFKIDEDVNGNGTSLIKKSLFYAKLYLMLLLFKIMSIILYSNDQRVNYVKQSGIDKNIANKVQEIARIKQSRQINITDLFSYTTLINKVGNGSEQYIPVGRSGERPIETEILSGQDVPLNSDLLEMLKNAYILGTGVPAAIVNYLQEADFAKTVEQNNTKFNGRVVNYQLDFNKSITELYKKIMRSSTRIPENEIENFKFILQPPKATPLSAKSELIQNFNALADFLISLKYDDPQNSMNAETLVQEIREFKTLLAEDQLQMIDFKHMDELFKQAKVNVLKNKLEPKAANGDNGDDIGMEDLGEI